ncbi:hypothetical protein [Streptomyces chengbuensis]|uniref:hypothetical protein n=1 Tax=Streptomyces chengbuensis TaxID=3053466 RepID=UPI003F4CFADE
MAKPPVLTPQAEDFPRWYRDHQQGRARRQRSRARRHGDPPARLRALGAEQQEMDARIKEAGAAH